MELDLAHVPAALDLPAVPRAPGVDLPSVTGRAAAQTRKAQSFGEPELPSLATEFPKHKAPSVPDDAEFELPSIPNKTSAPTFGAGPAAQRAAQTLQGHAGLPSVPSGSAPGLPAVASNAGLPDVARGNSRTTQLGGVGLPSVSQTELPSISGAGLPQISGAALPSVSGTGLPAVRHNEFALDDGLDLEADVSAPPRKAAAPSLPPDFGSLDLVPPDAGGGFELEAPSFDAATEPKGGGGFGELELPPIGPDISSSKSGSFGAVRSPSGAFGGPKPARAFGEIADDDPFGEVPLPEPEMKGSASGRKASSPNAPSQKVVRQEGGGTAFGEVNLDGGDSGMEADLPIEAAAGSAIGTADDEMEFGGVPQETAKTSTHERTAAQAPAVSSAKAVPVGRPAEKQKPRSGKRALKVASVLVLLTVGGGALALVPSLGPFGMYWISDRLKADEHARLVTQTADTARRSMARDIYPQAKAATAAIDDARASAKRVKALAAYAAFNGYLTELRFLAEPDVRARAKVLLDELREETDVEYLELARAAEAAADGLYPRARELVKSAKSIDALALRGEIELHAKDAKSARESWTALQALEPGARATFGLARAEQLLGDASATEKLLRETLAQNPSHVGARILLARLGVGTRDKEPEAEKLLQAIAAEPKLASPGEVVAVQTLLGDLQLSRSRVSLAELAYGEALKIEPKSAPALVGLGEALFRAGRYAEAQARFEAATQADKSDVNAGVGIAKSKLLLERVQEAAAILRTLRESNPASPLVQYWYGRALETAGDRKEAEAAYRLATQGNVRDSSVVDAYIALALLANQDGKADQAQKILAGAREKMPNSPAIHKAIGDVFLSQGRYADGIGEFQHALKLDPEDLGAKFKLGSGLRRDKKFEEAKKTLDEVAAIDRDYPGLALERGLLFEASGRIEDALQAYEGALAKAPKDPDLMLRVGCGKATLGNAKQAEPLLREVMAQRPTSSEAHHCLGRALLVEGTRLADALRLLERAVELDPNRAEYHLYVGWAANDAGNAPRAEKALTEALKLDQGLADAYWQRGVLRERQGAVRDAITDLTKALELRPSRFEAHATLADAYYDLGKEPLALEHWAKAVGAQSENATWRFRYGKLLAANRMTDRAKEELSAALKLIASADPQPRWAWEAHHLLARTLGPVPDAVPHWEAFLKTGPRDSPYRAEAKTALQKLGRPWTGD
jgi:tetratricopeptide (TPR) repeat protein